MRTVGTQGDGGIHDNQALLGELLPWGRRAPQAGGGRARVLPGADAPHATTA
jgi:hypothetical protein